MARNTIKVNDHDRLQKVETDVELMKKDIDGILKITEKLDVTNTKIQSLVDNVEKIATLHDTKIEMSAKRVDDLTITVAALSKEIDTIKQFKWKITGGTLAFVSIINLIIGCVTVWATLNAGK